MRVTASHQRDVLILLGGTALIIAAAGAAIYFMT